MKKNIQHMLEKAGITGIASAAVGLGLLGKDVYYRPANSKTQIPMPLITASLGIANSFITDGIHTLLNKSVPLGKKTADRTAFATNAAVSGVTFFVLLHVLGQNIPYSYSIPRAFATGALGEMGGAASYEYLVNNLYF